MQHNNTRHSHQVRYSGQLYWVGLPLAVRVFVAVVVAVVGGVGVGVGNGDGDGDGIRSPNS